ncbi:MAG: hypothetical protein O2904_00405 [bacterium]|nr:hypothetical protein [bacterium]
MKNTLHFSRRFAHFHDDMPAFHAGYLVLTFLVASLFNLGAFALLIAAHMALDFVKYREHHNYSLHDTFEGMIRESLIDITLLFVAIVFSVYLHHSVVGVASLSGLVRAEVTLVRAAALLVPKMKILHHFLKVVSHLHHYMQQTQKQISKGWGQLDKLCFLFVGISVFLIVFASAITGTDQSTINWVLMEEMIPWNI